MDRLAHYRLPITNAPRVGALRAIVDRNGEMYLDGQRVEQAVPTGAFLVLTLRDAAVRYVLAAEFDALRAAAAARRKRPSRRSDRD
jgi:hypothetical protein